MHWRELLAWAVTLTPPLLIVYLLGPLAVAKFLLGCGAMLAILFCWAYAVLYILDAQ